MANKNCICALMYHMVSPSCQNKYKNNPYVISTKNFSEQMKILYEKRFHTLTLEEMERYVKGEIYLPKKSILLTFDDGYKNNYIYVYDILKKYNFKAASFLITNNIGSKDERYLDWNDINKMKDIFQFASHTHNLHFTDSNGISFLLSKPQETIINDLKKSIKILNTKYFNYPFGQYNYEIIKILKQVDFSMAFTANKGYIQPLDNIYALNRIGIYQTTSIEEFENFIRF